MSRRHHSSKSTNHPSSGSESSEDDAFTALSSRNKKKRAVVTKSKANNNNHVTMTSTTASPKTTGASSMGIISSNKMAQLDHTPTTKSSENQAISDNSKLSISGTKRHHHTSTERQAKMDALLDELQETEDQLISNSSSRYHHQQHASQQHHQQVQQQEAMIPDKRGSFVEDGEEFSTTNIFVANLSPSVTEEALTDLFRQFGDLYSLKIMWPRTSEEKARNRNTGFVCFMSRCDAEEAMETFNHTDPFCNGRRMVLRWGKNVKKTVRRGTGSGVLIPPIRKRARVDGGTVFHSYPKVEGGEDFLLSEENQQLLEGNGAATASYDCNSNLVPSEGIAASELVKAIQLPPYNPLSDQQSAIQVTLPESPARLCFITTIASFVAKDGSIIEQSLMERERLNPDFSFLFPNSNNIQERIFYRWRVYAFAQGDGYHYWRTEPFQMFYYPSFYAGSDNQICVFWIPPGIVDHDKARYERHQSKLREEEIYNLKLERNRSASSSHKDYMTGRQYELHGKSSSNENNPNINSSPSVVKLNNWENEQFQTLFFKKLSISRAAICQMMSFCFDKSAAAVEISSYIHESFLPSRDEGESERTIAQLSTNQHINTLIARLYLISDVLFNSQQPGVRNAFRYRETIQNMAPSVFTALGAYKKKLGRITWNKLQNAVQTVLKAWADWSAYHVGFLKELEELFHYGVITTKEDDGNQEDNTKDDAQTQSSLLDGDNDKECNAKDQIKEDDDIDGEALLDDDDDLDGEALDDTDEDDSNYGKNDNITSSITTNTEIEKKLQDTQEEKNTSTTNHHPRGGWEIVDDNDDKKPDDGNNEDLLNEDLDGESLSDDDVLLFDDKND